MHRTKGYKQTTYSNCDYTKSSGNCQDGYCCTWYEDPHYQCDWYYNTTKYSGSKARQERIYLRWYSALNAVTKTVTVADRTNTTSWTYKCASQSQYSYTANFNEIRVDTFPNGGAVVLWRDNTAIRGEVYNASGTLVKDLGTLGSSWSGYDVATHKDDSFLIVWSNGTHLYGQLYTPSGLPDGSQITISEAAGAKTWPRVATYNNGRFAVAWETAADGDQDIMTRIFKKDGTPVSPAEVKANTEDNGNETRPVVGAYDNDGAFVVVWEGADPAGRGIYAQFFTGIATPIGTEKIVNVNTTGNQTDPNVTVLASHDGVIAWRGGDGHVYARKYDSAGEALLDSKELIHNDATANDQQAPRAAPQAATGYVTVYQTSDDLNDVDVVARRFDLAGAPAGGEFQVNSTDVSYQTSPVVDTDTAGGFVVAWEHLNLTADVEDVIFRRFNADGTPAGIEVMANQQLTGEQYQPAIAVDRGLGVDGRFALAWTSFEQNPGNDYDIVARCFGADDAPITDEFVVNTTVANDQVTPDLAWLADGPARFIVTWASKNEDGDNWGIYAQRLSATCLLQGGPFQVNATTANVQSQPVVAAASDGSFVIAWRSLNQDGDNFGVYGQRYTNAGDTDGVEFKINTITANEQSTPTLTFLSDDTLLAGWMTLGEDESVSAVKFRHYNADFTTDGHAHLGNIYYQSDQDSPTLVPLPGAEYGILWRSNGQDGDGGTIIGRILP